VLVAFVLQWAPMDRSPVRPGVQGSAGWRYFPFVSLSRGGLLLRDVWDLGRGRAIDLIQIALNDPSRQKFAHCLTYTRVGGLADAIVPQRWAEARRPASF